MSVPTHCSRGHALTPKNTRVTKHKQVCLVCERARHRYETVTCPGCGKTRERQVKSCYVHSDGTCRTCALALVTDRRLEPLTVDGVTYDQLAAWWLENFSMQEIRELAEGLTGGFSIRQEVTT